MSSRILATSTLILWLVWQHISHLRSRMFFVAINLSRAIRTRDKIARYRSLVGNANGNGCGQGTRRFSSSSHCRSLHRSHMTLTKITQETTTLSLSDATCVSGNEESPGVRKIPLQDCLFFTNGMNQSVENQYVGRKVNEGTGDILFEEDLTSQDAMDSDFQDQADKYIHNNKTVSSQSSSESSIGDAILQDTCVDKQLLCKACQNLRKRVLKNKSAGVKLFKIFDPNHWCCDYWMLVNRVPHKDGSLKSKIKRNIRTTLNTIVALQDNLPNRTRKMCLKCSRPHSFLQRNLRLCKQGWQLCAVSPKPQRKTSSNCRLKRTDKRALENKRNSQKPYVFVVSSNQDEDSETDLKRCKIRDDGNKKLVSKRDLTSPLTRDRFSLSDSMEKKQPPRSERSNVSQHSVDMEENDTESLPNTRDMSNETSDPFSWIQQGSFRDLLVQLNSGYLKSAIIKE
ncbi:uncharacterized protein RCH25_004513 [Pelodytes ibericus]